MAGNSTSDRKSQVQRPNHYTTEHGAEAELNPGRAAISVGFKISILQGHSPRPHTREDL